MLQNNKADIMKNNKINPALKELGVLVGNWKATGTHGFFPGVMLHGHTSFEWIEGGAFLAMRSSIEHKDFPKGLAIFGFDDSTKKGVMIYFDSRDISRIIEWSFEGNVLQWWRNTSDFSQRYSFTITDHGNTIISKGELSKDGFTWEKDLDLAYTRIKD
jgi:hypothetical protein